MSAEEPIDIPVNFQTSGAQRGAAQLAGSLEGVAAGAQDVAAGTTAASTSFATMARGGTQLVQRVQGVAGAVQSLTSALGSRDRTAGLVASMAGTVAQFTAMGAMLGPGGAVVGGLAGAVAGLAGVAQAADRARDSMIAMNAATVDAMRGISSAIAGGDESAWSGAMATALAQIVTLEAAAADLRETAGSTMVGLLDPMGAASARVELRRVEDTIRALRSSISALSDEMADSPLVAPTGGRGIQSFLDNDPLSAIRRRPAEERRSGGGSGGDGRADAARESAEGADAWVRAQAAAEDEAHRLRIAGDREREEARNAELERIVEFQAAAIAEAQEYADAQVEIEREKISAIEELEAEQADRDKAKRRDEIDERVAQQEEFLALGMNVTGMMTDALGSLAAGEQSADEAFKGLAKSFLQMIAQYTAMKAATEFADAIASFARYDYGGGAAHVAAGVAFTAVSVATGVGSALINTRPSAPARPEAQANNDRGGGGGDTIINWNSPVVTASTRDDLGRDIGAMIRAGEDRYGRAA